MSDIVRLLLMLGLAGAALTLLGSVAIWHMDEQRRIRRGLRRVLGAAPEAVVVAHGRGRGAGFSFATGLAAVAWDSGAWCLVYRIDELVGAELLVNGAVVARAHRGEPRRALEQVANAADDVTLRLLFDDPRDPDFILDLWIAGDDPGRSKTTPSEAIKEANRWMARAEAILRRPLPPQADPSGPVEAPPPIQRPVADDPPWRDEPDSGLDEAGEIEIDDEDWPDLPKRIS